MSKVFPGEAAVYENLRRINRKFTPLEERGPRASVNVPPSVPAKGGAPTVVVAASDASDLSKSKADFLCTGENDQFVIQDAIDSLPSDGGRVLLSEGTFNVVVPAGDAAITLPSNATLEGMGFQSTVLSEDNDSDPGVGSYMIACGQSYNTIRDLALSFFHSIRGIKVATSGLFAENHRIQNIDSVSGFAAIYIDRATHVWIEGCYLRSLSTLDEGVIEVDSTTVHASTDMWIERNLITGGKYGIHFDANTHGRIRINDNYMNGPGFSHILFESNPAFLHIVGNLLQGAGQEALTSDEAGMIQLHGDTAEDVTEASSGEEFNIIVALNILEAATAMHGIKLDGINAADIRGNLIEDTEQHGIYLTDSYDCVIADNRIGFYGGSTADTHDAIHLDAGSDRNYIHHNTVIDDTSASAQEWRYGINVTTAAGAANKVLANDLTGFVGGTAPMITKAGTTLTYPGDATFGDNFT